MQPTATTRPSPAYARIQDLLAAERCVILDGGVATELQRGRPLEGGGVVDRDLWGTWALYRAPDAVLGVHMVGPWVTEQLGQAYLSVNWEATVDEVARFIQPHPTLSESFGETVMSLTGRGLHG